MFWCLSVVTVGYRQTDRHVLAYVLVFVCYHNWVLTDIGRYKHVLVYVLVFGCYYRWVQTDWQTLEDVNTCWCLFWCLSVSIVGYKQTDRDRDMQTRVNFV